MKDYYFNDLKIITNLKLNNQEYRIYNYCCANYNFKKLEPYIRLVDIAGYFQLSVATVKEILNSLAAIEIDNKKLLKIFFVNGYVDFEMPYYKSFIEELGFKKNNTTSGFKNITDKIKELNSKADNKKYLFPKLDQFDLSEALRDMPDEDFEKIKSTDLRFPWVYHDEKARRTDTK